MRVQEYRSFLSSQRHVLDLETTNVDNFKKKIQDLTESKLNMVKAQATIDKMTQIVSARGLGKIESIVSGGLKLVFGKKVSLVIEKKEGTRGTSYRLLIKKGDTIGDPFDSFGGGIINVASLLFRVIMVKRFKTAKFMAIDEGMNNVSIEYQDKVSQLLKTLTESYGFKILLITHSPIFAQNSDKIYKVSDSDIGPTITEINYQDL
jgi:DNA repair exonuclease SbcCD ATPase subunit